jgi:Flp pilus assembly protein TadG
VILPARRAERGSVLMLMPVAVLIVLLLGAIAVDSAIVYLGQRQAYNVAFDAANDAAGAGFDPDAARTSGEIVYDRDRVEALAAQAVAAARLDDLELVSAEIDGTEVVVTVRRTVEHLFVQVLGDPARDEVVVSARVTGEVHRPSAEP